MSAQQQEIEQNNAYRFISTEFISTVRELTQQDPARSVIIHRTDANDNIRQSSPIEPNATSIVITASPQEQINIVRIKED